MIGSTVQHYRIDSRLGTGGMGQVYLAEDLKLHRKVAIKFLPPAEAKNAELKQRFLHEANAHAKLSHPNIATFLDIQDSEHGPFIVLEYVDGQTLSELAESRKLPLAEILDLVIQACDGLKAAHEANVVHRDIKPGNLMVTGDGHVKILDFGLARWRGASKITRTGTQLGTAAYMSPEQALGHKVDHRSDIFSLGGVLYELVCGRPPFEGEGEQAMLYEVVNEDPEPMARYSKSAPDGLQQIVSKCLAKRPEERYQSAADLAADLRRLKREVESGVTVKARPTRRKRRVQFVAGGLAVVVALWAIYFLDRIDVQFNPDPGAVAAENSLAVMYFDNLVDPEDSDRSADILSSLLITDLSESEYLRVVSRQRLYDILQQLGQGDSRKVDRSTARQVADKAGVRYVVTGDILQVAPAVELTVTVSEAESGQNVSAHRLTSEPGENLFAVADRLGAAIMEDLGLPAAAKSEADRPVAEVTTQSEQAYRYYLEGQDYADRQFLQEAIESYQKALEFDSTLAMAHYHLSLLFGYLPVDEVSMHVDKAIQYADQATWKEQRLIDALKAARIDNSQSGRVAAYQAIVERYPDDKEGHFRLGHALWNNLNPEYNRATEHLERAVELDPRYKAAWDDLAYVNLYHTKDLEKALWATNQYLAVAPDDAEPYYTRGEVLVQMDRYQDAIASFERALEVNPEFHRAHIDLGLVHLFNLQDYSEADRHFRAIASHSSPAIRKQGRSLLPLIPLYRGQFKRGLEMLDQGIAADRLEGGRSGEIVRRHVIKARIYTELGDWSSAMAELESADSIEQRLHPDDSMFWTEFELEVLARRGDLAEADSLYARYRGHLSQFGELGQSQSWYCAGLLEEARGNLREATSYYDSCHRTMHPHWQFMSQYVLGRALLKTGELGAATDLLEDLIHSLDEATRYHPFWVAERSYYLGLAYEQSGWKKEAIAQYEEFLDIWSEADPDLPMLNDARQRLVDLTS